MKLKDLILYEDDFVIAINKPAGLVVHPDGKTVETSVSDLILKDRPEMEAVGESWTNPESVTIPRPGIVHRLDRDTSGVLIIAKTQDCFENLKSQFQNHKIKKTYHAFVYGNVKNDEGIIDKPIGRSAQDFRMYSAQRGAKGEMREAVTEYKTLARFLKEGEQFSFLEIYPKTGRTHQIRVHLKYANHPIVSDKLYAKGKPQALGFTRTALHSSSIVFALPDGQQKEIKASFPEDFNDNIKDLGIEIK